MTAPEGVTEEFSNLIIRVINGEIIRAYINVYSLTPEYVASNGLVLGSDYSGVISSYSLEGSGIDLGRSTVDKLGAGLTPMKTRTIVDGLSIGITISQDCNPPDPPDHTDDDPNDDNNDSSNNTGGGGEPDEPDNDHQDTGTTDHDPSGGGSDPTGPDGGGGGTSDCDFEIYTNCCNRNWCDPHGPRPPQPLCSGTNAVVIDCSDDRSANTTGETVNVDYTDCPDDDIIVINPPSIEELCEEIIAQNNDPDFQEKVNQVNSDTALDMPHEVGFAQKTDGEYTDPLPVLEDKNVDFPEGGIEGLIGLMHSHYNDFTDPFGEFFSGYKIFSDADVLILFFLVQEAYVANLPLEDAYMNVYTGDNDYTLRFNGDYQNIINYLQNTYNGIVSDREGMINAYRKAMDENGGDLEKGLLKYMRDTLLIPNDMGIQLFRNNDDGSVTHLVLDENGEVIETNC